MNIKHFFIAGLTLLVFSCQSGGEEKVTPSGYKYKIHTSADGAKPQPGEYVYFHAQMRNENEVVNSSREQGQEPFMQIPTANDPSRQASPVEEILTEMSIGDSATIYISLDTIEQKPQGFENTNTMYYDLVLTSIMTADEYAAAMQQKRAEADALASVVRERESEVKALVDETVAKYASGALDGQLQTTSSGLKYMIVEEGTGNVPVPGKVVSVQYYGTLTDGKEFDQSFKRGMPIEFPLGTGRVIPGWDEGIALMKEGAKAFLFIPSDLAYGEAGSPPDIPGNSELIFYVELENIK